MPVTVTPKISDVRKEDAERTLRLTLKMISSVTLFRQQLLMTSFKNVCHETFLQCEVAAM